MAPVAPKGRHGRNPRSGRRRRPYPLLLPSPLPVSAAGQSLGDVGGGGAFPGRGGWSPVAARGVVAALGRGARWSSSCWRRGFGGCERRAPTAAGSALCRGGGVARPDLRGRLLAAASVGWRGAPGQRRRAAPGWWTHWSWPAGAGAPPGRAASSNGGDAGLCGGLLVGGGPGGGWRAKAAAWPCGQRRQRRRGKAGACPWGRPGQWGRAKAGACPCGRPRLWSAAGLGCSGCCRGGRGGLDPAEEGRNQGRNTCGFPSIRYGTRRHDPSAAPGRVRCPWS